MSLSEIKEKLDKSSEEMNKISERIKDLEKILIDGKYMGSFHLPIEDDLSIFWNEDKRRIFSIYMEKVRPLIEQPIKARILANENWEDLLKMINDSIPRYIPEPTIQEVLKGN